MGSCGVRSGVRGYGGALQERRSAWATLACCYSIFFTQYAISLMISPFFPTSPAGTAIGGVMVGAVFAAYSLAVAVATHALLWSCLACAALYSDLTHSTIPRQPAC